MEINGAMSNLGFNQRFEQKKVVTPTPIMPVKTVAPNADVVTDDAEKTSAFYTYEKEPWLNTSGPDAARTREGFIEEQLMEAMTALRKMEQSYTAFRKQLVSLNPELAKKNFGFTLDKNTALKVTDPQMTLTDQEKNWLTIAFNDSNVLKDNVHRHAKAAMALVDHYTEQFGNRYNLSLDNFHKTIDYAKLFDGKNNLVQEWINQVHAEAEKRTPENIDVEV